MTFKDATASEGCISAKLERTWLCIRFVLHLSFGFSWEYGFEWRTNCNSVRDTTYLPVKLTNYCLTLSTFYHDGKNHSKWSWADRKRPN